MKDWKGGDCPLAPGTPYEARHRDGTMVEGEKPELDIWSWTGKAWDIVAYRAKSDGVPPDGWIDISLAAKPDIGKPGSGKRIMLCVDCGPDTKRSHKIGWWDGTQWISDDSGVPIKKQGYRTVFWRYLPELPL